MSRVPRVLAGGSAADPLVRCRSSPCAGASFSGVNGRDRVSSYPCNARLTAVIRAAKKSLRNSVLAATLLSSTGAGAAFLATVVGTPDSLAAPRGGSRTRSGRNPYSLPNLRHDGASDRTSPSCSSSEDVLDKVRFPH